MNKRETGSRYEGRAAKFLEDKGYTILEKNFRCKLGEIDLIGKSENYLCFIEVKYRSDSGHGFPSEAIDYRKQKRIINSAMTYMNFHRLPLDTPCRFDVVVILNQEFKLIKNAFEAI